jgi:chromosome segregation ATPase
MSDASREYHNLQYAIDILQRSIKSCKLELLVAEKYQPQLDSAVAKLKRLEEQIKEEKGNPNKQRDRWCRELHKMASLVVTDETISDNLRERLVEGLLSLVEMVELHVDS